MSRPARQHGTRSCYMGGCRCEPCTEANSAYYRTYWRDYRRHLEGTPDVPVGPVRAHVDRLRAAGMGKRQIAKVSGVSVQSIDYLYKAKRGVRPKTAKALMSVRLDTYLVPSTGPRRRVRALARLGWTIQHIADAAGLPRHVVAALMSGETRHPKSTTADAVATAYNRLSMKLGPSDRARRRAKARNWPPPLAYDNIDSDDGPVWDPARCSVPECNAPSRSRGLCGRHYARLNRRLRKSDADDTLDEIAITRAIASGGVKLTRAERLEVIRRMAAAGHSDPTIAEHCGCTHRTVERVRQVNGIASRWQRSVA